MARVCTVMRIKVGFPTWVPLVASSGVPPCGSCITNCYFDPRVRVLHARRDRRLWMDGEVTCLIGLVRRHHASLGPAPWERKAAGAKKD
eukprot:2739523-Amphidinium_carterae.1